MRPVEDGIVTVGGSQTSRNIRFKAGLPALRDAWRAVSAVRSDGNFTMTVARERIRLLVQAEVAVEAVIPITDTVGAAMGEELFLNLASDSLAALGYGDLEENGTLDFKDVQPEEGFVGVLKLQSSFSITSPYTLTKVGAVFVDEQEEYVSAQSVDPRVIRQVLAEIRNFAGENDAAGNNLKTLQVCDREALGMSPTACQSVKSDRLEGIYLRVSAADAKPLGALLGQLRPSETRLAVSGDKCVFLDGRLKIVVPLAPPLPSWPDGGPVKANFQLDVSDLTSAIAAIVGQAHQDNPIVSLGAKVDAEALVLTTAVPGGIAIASCPIASTNRVQATELALRFSASTLASFSTRNGDAVQLRVFEHFVEVEQVSSSEQRKTLLLMQRARSYS